MSSPPPTALMLASTISDGRPRNHTVAPAEVKPVAADILPHKVHPQRCGGHPIDRTSDFRVLGFPGRRRYRVGIDVVPAVAFLNASEDASPGGCGIAPPACWLMMAGTASPVIPRNLCVLECMGIGHR